MFRALPPSGFPIKFADILYGLFAMFSRQGPVSKFNQEICNYFGVSHAVTVSSGRAGLSLLFRALHKLNPGCDEVLIPAFTSFSVPSAVVNAGFKVSLYDLDPVTLSPERESLARAINDKTLCIVICHLFGYPADIDAVLKLAAERQITVVDDAAQAMGAFYKGKPVGTFGRAGLFSLSRGKNITAVDGGIIITNDDSLAKAIDSVDLEPIGVKDYLILIIKAVVLSFMLNPCCYWLPRSIPWLNIGASHFSPNFTLSVFTAFQAGIATRMLNRLDMINSERKRLAIRLTNLLSTNKSILLPQVVTGGESVFLRFPIIASLSAEKPELGIVRSYPAAIQHVHGIEQYLTTHESFPGADRLAEQIYTLPTHCYVTDDDCQRMAEYVSGAIQ